jgi:hypothetical protein
MIFPFQGWVYLDHQRFIFAGGEMYLGEVSGEKSLVLITKIRVLCDRFSPLNPWPYRQGHGSVKL